MDINVQLGNVQLSFTSSPSACSVSTTPKIHATENKLEKTVELFHFTGTIKITSLDDGGAPQIRTNMGSQGVGEKSNSSKSNRLLNMMGMNKRLLSSTHDNHVQQRSGRVPELYPSSNEIDAMTTSLHISCASQTPRVQEMETILNSNPGAVFIPDKNGNLNMESKDELETFANKLLQANPESIIMKNNIGRIPFVHYINHWIDKALSSTDKDVIITPKIIPGLHDFFTTFPTSLKLPPMVEWAILMLSSAMDQHGDHIFCAIADSVASIPLLVKTILLIESRNMRHKILSTTLFKRVILDKRTAGLWLVPMLRVGEPFSMRCIDYFELVSNSTVTNFIGTKRMANISDIEMFQISRSLVYKQIGKSKFFIPSLCLASTDEKTRAAKTKVIKEILDDALNNKFTLSLFRNDIFMLISLLISFRVLAFNAGVAATIPEAKNLMQEDLLFTETYTDFFICLAINVYLVLRKISQSISLYSISFSILWRTVFQTWLVQITTIVMIFISLISIVVNTENRNAWVLSITGGLMWLSIVYLLQKILKPMYLFTIVVRKILTSMYWLWLLLAIIIFMFGGDECDLLTTSYSNGKMFTGRRLINEQYHHGDVVMTSPFVEEESNVISSVTELFENYNEVHPFCTSDVRQSYMAMFGIVLHQFDPNFFFGSTFTMFLFCVFAFLACIFLLTLLITLVGESYEKLKEKSEEDYYQKRVDFAGELVMLRNSILHSKFEDMNVIQKVTFIYHWAVLFSTFVLYAVMCRMYVLNLTSEPAENVIKYEGLYGNRTARHIVIIAQIIIIGLNQALLFDFIFQYYAAEGGLLMTLRKCITTPIRIIFPHLRQLTNKIGIAVDQDEETGRLISFERSIKEIVTESEKRICKSFNKTEERILSNGEEMKYCLVDLMDNMPSTTSDDGSSCSSNASSHISFTREDLGLAYPI